MYCDQRNRNTIVPTKDHIHPELHSMQKCRNPESDDLQISHKLNQQTLQKNGPPSRYVTIRTLNTRTYYNFQPWRLAAVLTKQASSPDTKHRSAWKQGTIFYTVLLSSLGHGWYSRNPQSPYPLGEPLDQQTWGHTKEWLRSSNRLPCFLVKRCEQMTKTTVQRQATRTEKESVF